MTIGAYGLFSSILTDFWEIAKDIYESGYTGLALHLLGPWCQVPNKPLYPWPMRPDGRFDMRKDSEDWYTRLAVLLAAFEFYGLDLMLNFDDQYFTQKWISKTKAKVHPYRKNNVGYQPTDEKEIYDSIELPSGKFNWIGWDDISESQNKFRFHLIGEFGKARDRWIARNLMMVKDARDASLRLKGAQQPGDRTWRIAIRRANEEQAKIDPKTGETSHALSLGDRSEIFSWLRDKMKAIGLTPNWRNLFTVVNRDVVGGTEEQRFRHWTILNRDITAPWGVRFGMDSLHEIHVDSAAAVEDLETFSQLRIHKTLVSNDGMPKLSGMQFTNDSRALYQFMKSQGVPFFFDQLFEEGLWKEKSGLPHDTMNNWRKFFKYHKEIVK